MIKNVSGVVVSGSSGEMDVDLQPPRLCSLHAAAAPLPQPSPRRSSGTGGLAGHRRYEKAFGDEEEEQQQEQRQRAARADRVLDAEGPSRDVVEDERDDGEHH